jgi:diguanylate cyclase (GGDEF)-like protein/PAS domain S-box-containing protein
MNRSQEELLAFAAVALLSNICVLDGAGNIVAVNQAWRDFASRQGAVASDDFIGRNYLTLCDAVVGEDAPVAAAVAAGIRGVLRGDIHAFAHNYPCHAPNAQRWFSVRITKFQGHEPHVAMSHINITDLMLASAVKDAYQQKLLRLQKLYAAIAEADQLIYQSSDLPLLFTEICRIAVDLGGLTMAWVGEPNLETERIVPVASYGAGRSFLDGIFVSTRADVPEGRGPTGIAFRENRTTINQNFQIDANIQPWRGRSTPFHWQSLATFPVRRAGAVVALLVVYSTEANTFDQEEVILLEKLSANLGQAADAIATAQQKQLLEQQLKQSEETYRTLFETVRQGVVFQDKEGKIIAANPAAERILGLSLAQMQGRTSMDPRWGTIRLDGSPFPGEAHPAMLALTSGQPVYGVVMGISKPNAADVVWINIHATPILTKGTGAVEYVYAVFDDITETVHLQRELENQANRDFLTDVASRRYFFTLGSQELARAERYAGEVSMLMLDVDHFKEVNDTYGHAAGDLVLKGVAQLCKEALREVDVLGRIGGEEFAILLPQTSGEVALDVAERIRQAVKDSGIHISTQADATPVHVTVSIGVSTIGTAGVTIDALLQAADTALYQAKQSGKDRVCCSFDSAAYAVKTVRTPV